MPKDIRFYITMMKVAVNLMQEGSINTGILVQITQKRRLGMFVQRVTVLLKRLIKEKDISCPYCD